MFNHMPESEPEVPSNPEFKSNAFVAPGLKGERGELNLEDTG